MPESKKNDIKTKKLKDDAKMGVAIIASAALFFGCIFAIERGMNNQEDPVVGDVSVSPHTDSTYTSTSVVINTYDPLKEYVNKPVTNNIELVRPFYDSSLPVEERMKAIVNLPGEDKYFKSCGEDYCSETKFNVYAAFSGKVTKTMNNSIYGNVVWIEHESGLIAVYASLSNMKLLEGQDVKQNDVIGSSGISPYTQELGNETTHFELLKDGNYVNPTSTYGKLAINV